VCGFLSRHPIRRHVVALNEKFFKYVIVGGGVAGASAVAGIRDMDTPAPFFSFAANPIFRITGRLFPRGSGWERSP